MEREGGKPSGRIFVPCSLFCLSTCFFFVSCTTIYARMDVSVSVSVGGPLLRRCVCSAVRWHWGSLVCHTSCFTNMGDTIPVRKLVKCLGSRALGESFAMAGLLASNRRPKVFPNNVTALRRLTPRSINRPWLDSSPTAPPLGVGNWSVV